MDGWQIIHRTFKHIVIRLKNTKDNLNEVENIWFCHLLAIHAIFGVLLCVCFLTVFKSGHLWFWGFVPLCDQFSHDKIQYKAHFKLILKYIISLYSLQCNRMMTMITVVVVTMMWAIMMMNDGDDEELRWRWEWWWWWWWRQWYLPFMNPKSVPPSNMSILTEAFIARILSR